MPSADLDAAIAAQLAQPPQRYRWEAVSGGDINRAYRLTDRKGGRWFVKINRAERIEMFAAEWDGLTALAATHTVRIPQPLGYGTTAEEAFLILEWLPLQPHGSGTRLGEQLAELHHATAAPFGWHRDNTIGTTPQQNRWQSEWLPFWREARLEPQLARAEQNRLPPATLNRAAQLLEQMERWFSGYHPTPSLLHGDLWSGNVAFLPDGAAVLFDPAPYYGDREVDLAMSELFGGFSRDFYTAYHAAWPLDSGYPIRRDLYNLYHQLNHFNLFGGHYATSVRHTIEQLLAAG